MPKIDKTLEKLKDEGVIRRIIDKFEQIH